jgi:predicted metal-dependent peptidase
MIDTCVQAVHEFTPDDEIVLKMVGGGGTLFQPAFDWVEENDVDPLALIYLTDLEGETPQAPDYPVLWVTPLHSTYEAPFGTLVRIS